MRKKKKLSLNNGSIELEFKFQINIKKKSIKTTLVLLKDPNTFVQWIIFLILCIRVFFFNSSKETLRNPKHYLYIRIRDFILCIKKNYLTYHLCSLPYPQTIISVIFFSLQFKRNTHPSVSIWYFYLLSRKRIINYFFFQF